MPSTPCLERCCSGYPPDFDSHRNNLQPQRGKHSVNVSLSLTADLLDAIKNKARLVFVIGQIWKLKAIAGELFAFASIEFQVDPEVPGDSFLVFNVTASGEVREISSRRREWHHRTQGILGSDSSLVRLIIDVR